MLSFSKNRSVAALLAFSSLLTVPEQVMPGSSWHLAGLHKFYLGQPIWGVIYLCFSWTPIPMVASVMEALWYLYQDPDLFAANFSNEGGESAPVSLRNAVQVPNIAQAVRELDQLREDGLITEYEFEEKRRALLGQIR